MIMSLNGDVFPQIFGFLDAKSTANLPFVCKYFNAITNSTLCKELWEIAAKNLGISRPFPGKTWKTTVCMAMDRYINRKFSLSYSGKQAKPGNNGRCLSYDTASGLFASKLAPKKHPYKIGLILDKNGRLIWQNRKGSRVLFVINRKNYSIEECVFNKSMLAINFIDEIGRSVVQAWDLNTGKQIVDFTLKFKAKHLIINEESIVLDTCPTSTIPPPNECVIFNWSTETAWCEFYSKFEKKQASQMEKIATVCIVIVTALILVCYTYG